MRPDHTCPQMKFDTHKDEFRDFIGPCKKTLKYPVVAPPGKKGAFRFFPCLIVLKKSLERTHQNNSGNENTLGLLLKHAFDEVPRIPSLRNATVRV